MKHDFLEIDWRIFLNRKNKEKVIVLGLILRVLEDKR